LSLLVFEGEGKWPRLNMYPRGDLEHGLKADAFLANVPLRERLCALSNTADSPYVRFSEPVLIGVDDHLLRVCTKFDVDRLICRPRSLVFVVFGILDKFEDKAGVL